MNGTGIASGNNLEREMIRNNRLCIRNVGKKRQILHLSTNVGAETATVAWHIREIYIHVGSKDERVNDELFRTATVLNCTMR